MQPSWIAIPLLFAPFAVTGLAQYTPGSPPHSYTAGNVLYPGGVPPTPPIGSPMLPMGGYGQPVARGGTGGGSRGGGSRPNHPGHQPGVVIPVYVGSIGYYADPEQPAPAAPAYSQDPAVVIVNQEYRPETAHPVVHDYTNVNLADSPPLNQRQSPPPPVSIQPADQSPTIYLIAMKDGTIVAALGYWMEDDTLNYITRDANRNRVSIDRVDREFSARLNSDRNVPFKLE